MEKPGIEPAIPGLQGIALIHYTTAASQRSDVVCGRVPWLYQYWPGGFMVLWFYVQELPKAQPAVLSVQIAKLKDSS